MRVEKGMLFRIFYICLAFCAFAEMIVEMHYSDYTPFWWQKIPFFYAISGFLSCILLILIAKGLGHWLKKEEDYWKKMESLLKREESHGE